MNVRCEPAAAAVGKQDGMSCRNRGRSGRRAVRRALRVLVPLLAITFAPLSAMAYSFVLPPGPILDIDLSGGAFDAVYDGTLERLTLVSDVDSIDTTGGTVMLGGPGQGTALFSIIMDLQGGAGFLGGSNGPFVGNLVQSLAFELRDTGSANELLLEGFYDNAVQLLNWPAISQFNAAAFGGAYTLTANSEFLQNGRIAPTGTLHINWVNFRVQDPLPNTPVTNMCQIGDTEIPPATAICFPGVQGLQDFVGQPNVDFTPVVAAPEPQLTVLLGLGLAGLLASRARS